MTNNELTEAYFLALGAKWKRIPKSSLSRGDYSKWGWFLGGRLISSASEVHCGEVKAKNADACVKFPSILESYPAFKEHVLEVMEGEFWPQIKILASRIDKSYQLFWVWTCIKNKEAFIQEIKSNNILHAAVISATRYWESKEDAEGS